MINNKIIYVDKNSDIPLFGIDFIGIIDRGTNVIEIKPLTLCNLECKYCFFARRTAGLCSPARVSSYKGQKS